MATVAERQINPKGKPIEIKMPMRSEVNQLRCPDGKGWWTNMSTDERTREAQKLARALPRGVCN